MSISDFCRWANIDRTTADEEIMLRRLKTKNIGGRILVAVADAERWLESLPTPQEPIDWPHAMIHYTAAGS